MDINNFKFDSVNLSNFNLTQYKDVISHFEGNPGLWELYSNILNGYITRGVDNQQAVIQSVQALVYSLNIFQNLYGIGAQGVRAAS